MQPITWSEASSVPIWHGGSGDNTELVREWQPLIPVFHVTQCLVLILPCFGFPWHRYWHLTYLTPAIITWSNNSRFLIALRTCCLQLNILSPELSKRIQSQSGDGKPQRQFYISNKWLWGMISYCLYVLWGLKCSKKGVTAPNHLSESRAHTMFLLILKHHSLWPSHGVTSVIVN